MIQIHGADIKKIMDSDGSHLSIFCISILQKGQHFELNTSIMFCIKIENKENKYENKTHVNLITLNCCVRKYSVRKCCVRLKCCVRKCNLYIRNLKYSLIFRKIKSL